MLEREVGEKEREGWHLLFLRKRMKHAQSCDFGGINGATGGGGKSEDPGHENPI